MPEQPPSVARVWNPFRRDAAYWQGKHGRLRRYIAGSFLGHVGLVLVLVLPMFLPGCKKTYDLVKGSGKPKAMIKQMKVEVKKVQRKRLIRAAAFRRRNEMVLRMQGRPATETRLQFDRVDEGIHVGLDELPRLIPLEGVANRCVHALQEAAAASLHEPEVQSERSQHAQNDPHMPLHQVRFRWQAR